jgi:hypothetical protein
MPSEWYESVEATARLTQGDIILKCPLVAWKSGQLQLEGRRETEVLKGATEITEADVVVMTQACDLEYEKVRNAVLCPHLSLPEHKLVWEETMRIKRQNPTPRAWKDYCNDICDGFVWNLTILNARNISELNIEHRIVDFHDIYTIPRVFLESLLVQRNQRRLRLLPPYREHLSQTFTRYFMRVGLPVTVTLAW